MNDIQTEILNDIKGAKQSIKVAVSWLTDITLINELIRARERAVDVKIVVSNNELNIIRFELFQKLLHIGADVRKEGNESPEDGNFMHYKFYIVDDKFAKSGSYNWSANATTNREKLDSVPVEKSLIEFTECYNNGVNFFYELENPEQKRAELSLIEKESKTALTPQKLSEYRSVQAALLKQELEFKKQLQEKEQQRKEAEEQAKIAKEKSDKILAEQRAREQQSQYGLKTDAPAISEAPPRSYAV